VTYRTLLISSLFSAAAFAASVSTSSSSSIGVITARGHFTLEGSEIYGNSTLFEGAKIETRNTSSELSLSNGVKVQLAANTAARIWSNRLELDHGAGQVTSNAAFTVSSGPMRVEGARYLVHADSNIEVAALTGSARVLNAKGGLIATVPAGRNMSFAMQQSVTREGCLVYKNNGFLLQSDEPNEVVQVTGEGLTANVGNRVIVSGPLTPTGATIAPATSVLNATAITMRTRGGCLTAAASLGASTTVTTAAAPGAATAPATAPATTPAPAKSAPAPTATKTGLSTGAKTAIIVGAAGGGAAAAAIALSSGNDKKSTSP
jgi:hypothetical protein